MSATWNTTHLAFSRVSKRFGKRSLLSNVSITLEGGHCLLLTGANGSGKTTLMRILAGLEKPDSFHVSLAQGEFNWRQVRNELMQQVMYLHQQPYMFAGTVWHNLAYALPSRLNRAERQARIQAISQWAGLDDIIGANAKSLSGGECQRVAIARARLRHPKALLLDEPTASMDSRSREKTLALMRQLCAEGVALLVTSHDPALFTGTASRFVHLEQQQLRVYEPLHQPLHPPLHQQPY